MWKYCPGCESTGPWMWKYWSPDVQILAPSGCAKKWPEMLLTDPEKWFWKNKAIGQVRRPNSFIWHVYWYCRWCSFFFENFLFLPTGVPAVLLHILLTYISPSEFLYWGIRVPIFGHPSAYIWASDCLYSGIQVPIFGHPSAYTTGPMRAL